ncbi:MAG: hypothetical protein COX80_04660 [Candidatus Magasanikbacteria bacterium CG_4_10_14_0_2_um_filter_33_14]|uniref:Uncharacterized protein n=1 Tax=Candidatus Magasanikbacteria bacterium CG_4_10_14_0_2_um_filter_33_14 TaxID=1974636 RepID=A0A2M7V965_9BACT|nr:MAG: hypothetical protein COX80_04660 [Candidatus Magasanikbacteria bacterium CG_4_10_14_0_2_um_filter_33_14]
MIRDIPKEQEVGIPLQIPMEEEGGILPIVEKGEEDEENDRLIIREDGEPVDNPRVIIRKI